MKEILFRFAEEFKINVNPGDIDIPQGGTEPIMATILKVVFATAGTISVLVLAIAGLRLVFSMGNPDGLTRTRNTIVYAAIGLVICVAGFSIVSFVVNRVG